MTGWYTVQEISSQSKQRLIRLHKKITLKRFHISPIRKFKIDNMEYKRLFQYDAYNYISMKCI